MSDLSFDLMSLNRSAMAGFLSSLDESPHRAKAIIQEIHQRRAIHFEQMGQLNKNLRLKLQTNANISIPTLIQEQISADGSCKWLLKLQDGNAIETVYMPTERRGTLCISSQVGCGLNCRFCATLKPDLIEI